MVLVSWKERWECGHVSHPLPHHLSVDIREGPGPLLMLGPFNWILLISLKTWPFLPLTEQLWDHNDVAGKLHPTCPQRANYRSDLSSVLSKWERDVDSRRSNTTAFWRIDPGSPELLPRTVAVSLKPESRKNSASQWRGWVESGRVSGGERLRYLERLRIQLDRRDQGVVSKTRQGDSSRPDRSEEGFIYFATFRSDSRCLWGTKKLRWMVVKCLVNDVIVKVHALEIVIAWVRRVWWMIWL